MCVMDDLALISTQPLDAPFFMKVWVALKPDHVVEPGDNRIYIDSQENPFWVGIDPPGYVPDGYEDWEIEVLHGLIDKPHFAVIEYHTVEDLDLAMLALPLDTVVWVDPSRGGLYTLAEVQQRIRWGVRWVEWSVDTIGADLVLEPRGGGKLHFVLLDDEPSISLAQREAAFEHKLALCLSHLVKNYTGYNDHVLPRWRRDFTIEVLCKDPPTASMQKLLSESLEKNSGLAVSGRFVDATAFQRDHGFDPRDLPSLRRDEAGQALLRMATVWIDLEKQMAANAE